jgi:hypothetical protein
MFAIWSTLLALFLCVVALASEQPMFVALLVLGSYMALIAAFIRTMRSTRDILNPLSVIVLLGTIRFTIPWLLVSSGIETQNTLFQLLRLESIDWQRGELLALVGMLAFSLGWMIMSDRGVTSWRMSYSLPPGIQYSGLVGMAIGLAALMAFLGGNAASIVTVVMEGTFRGTTIQEGTGAFFYLALLLPASSIVLCSYWIVQRRRFLALSAVGLSTIGFLTLGGRARAAVAIIAGILLIWYFGRRSGTRSLLSGRQSRFLIGLAGVAVSLVILYVGAVYRGNPRLPEGGLTSTAGVEAYASFGFLLDIGHLHALAASTAIGPVLNGSSLLGPLTFPLTEFIGVNEVSSGMFLVEETIGFSTPTSRRWGFDPSLMGDGYLNFGSAGVVVLCGIMGMALKVLYRKFRDGSIYAAVYVLAMIYSLRILFESIEKWAEMLAIVGFALLVIQASWLFAVRSSSRRAVPVTNGRGRHPARQSPRAP